MKLPLLVLLIFLINYTACQWIDPHDLNTNAKEKYMKPTIKKSSSTSSIPTGETNIDSDVCFSHLKRIVGVLINSAQIDKRDPASYYGNVRFTIDPDDLDFLLTFGKGSVSLDKLRKLDTIFSENFKKSLIYEYLDQIESYQTKLYSIVVNIHNLWLFGTICLLYFVYQLFKSNFSLSYIIKYLLMMVFVCDFVFRYQLLWEAAEEHNASVTYSSQCDSSKMTWSEWTKFMLINKDCERKTVTPLDVFLYQVKNLIIVPMHAFGTGLGGFGYNMFTTLPWGLNLIMWPLMLIFVIIMVVFTMVISTGQPIEFNIFYLFKLKFGGSRSERGENMLTGSTVEKLMDRILHRPMVQNITVSVPSGDKIENQQHESRTLLPDNSENAASSDVVNLTCSENTSENNFRPIEENMTNSKPQGTGIIDSKNQPCSGPSADGTNIPSTSKTDEHIDNIPEN